MENLAILIVDGNRETAAELQVTLASIRQRVVGNVADVQTAVRQVTSLQPDLIMVHLPPGSPMNEAARQLLEVHPAPIVLLADRQDEARVQSSLHSGTMAYLITPYTAQQLLETIETAWARFDERKALQDENDGLKEDLETRKFVERAKGVLMERLRLTEARAHDWLRERSRERRVALREFAKRILEAEEAGRPLPGTAEMK